MWNHAEEVSCVQRDPSASQPSNVSQPLDLLKEEETLGGVCGWDVGGKLGPVVAPSPIFRILADSSDSDAACISHHFMEQLYLQHYDACFSGINPVIHGTK